MHYVVAKLSNKVGWLNPTLSVQPFDRLSCRMFVQHFFLVRSRVGKIFACDQTFRPAFPLDEQMLQSFPALTTKFHPEASRVRHAIQFMSWLNRQIARGGRKVVRESNLGRNHS